MDDLELHARPPVPEDPPPAPAEEDPKRKALLERLALARAAKKPKTPAPDEGETQLPVERQKVRGKHKPRKKTLFRLTTEEKEAKAAAKKKKLEPSEIAGITPIGCPIACTPERCVITGENVCGHPAKGGLQPKYLGITAAMSRFNQARLELARLLAEQQKTKAL